MDDPPGEHVVNAEFRAHAQPTGGESQHLHLHHGIAGIDETHDVPIEDWRALLLATQGDDRDLFEEVLLAAVTPSCGWSPPYKEAAWRAALRMWAP
jgi:hypothetical protein